MFRRICRTARSCRPRSAEARRLLPAERIAPPAWMQAPETVRLLAVLAGGGAVVRFVGGCVRDAILGRPGRDIDVATPDPPDQVMRLLRAAEVRAIPTGIEHGTVTAVIGERHFEITTLRRDVENLGRRARVAFTDDWAADAARRDFTINALFADPDGTVYDPTGGLADLRAGRVRFVGTPAQRIAEDALRLLRYFRFHAHYGRGEPDAAALRACAAAAPSLRNLSGERLAGELLRLLEAPRPAPVLETMAACGVLAHLLPEAAGFARLARLCAIEADRDLADPLRRLAALLPADAAIAEAVAQRLRLSNVERERLAAMTQPEPAISPALDPAAIRRALYHLGPDRFGDIVLLGWSGADPAADDDWRALLQRAAGWVKPDFPLRGADVLALGLAPGPAVGELLAGVQRWWEAGDFQADRTAALAKLRELAGS